MSAAWKMNEIEGEKSRIRGTIVSHSDDPKERLSFILSTIQSLNNADLKRPLALQQVIFCISGIVHAGRAGGLSLKQCEELANLAMGILQLFKIDPYSSPEGFLFSEIYAAMSVVYKREGHHWAAAWRQIFGLEYRGSLRSTDEPHYKLLLGQRLARSGHTRDAALELQQVISEPGNLDARSRAIAGILLARCLRLLRDQEGARQALADLSSQGGTFEGNIETELRWEELCLGVSATGNLHDLLAATRSRGTHKQVAYLVEVSVWSFAHYNRLLLSRVRSMKQLAREHRSEIRDMGDFYRAALALENAYDEEIPLFLRIKGVCECLEQRPSFPSLEKELLVLAAAGRFFARTKSHSLLRFVLADYRDLISAPVEEKKPDPLGLINDLLASSQS